jgi:hypothetical protein
MEETIGIREDSNLAKSRDAYNKGGYSLNISREINDKSFFNEFLKYFEDIDSLSISAYGNGVSYNFLYQMSNLKNLNLHCMYEIDFVNLKNLENLSIWWNKKLIHNFDFLINLEHLSITEFDEKDLTKLSGLTNLKSLSFNTAKIKSLKGIETLTNLRSLSFGGVRSLGDISDISELKNLKFLEFDICWKLEDFSPIGELKELEVLMLLDCKNLASIKFVEKMPKLEQLAFLGTTIVNDYDITPAKNIEQVFGYNAKYNVNYEEKAKEPARKSFSTFLK